MRNYLNISGFDINNPNRGNVALNYGTLSFLEKKGLLNGKTDLISYRFSWNPKWLLKKSISIQNFYYNGQNWCYVKVFVFVLEKWLFLLFRILLPWSNFSSTLKNIYLSVADYGGDGFSDIYGQRLFLNRFLQFSVIKTARIPLIILPQTIGPFNKKKNYDFAVKVLRYADRVYVRDDMFINELKKLGIKYERTPDLSSFMLPEKWNIKVLPNAIGINVSGLAYSNQFNNLEGQFDVYPELINCLIDFFREKKLPVYLIPHSYNYTRPSSNNDDLIACKEVYKSYANDDGVFLIDKDLTSPQVKYVISRMSFFIGTRMHANFAAIYTGVPLFGLAYSYKFQGAFDANGLDGSKQTVMINNMSKNDIPKVIGMVNDLYNTIVTK